MKKPLFSVTIKDCRVDHFTVPGAGGGGKDTSQTGIRVTHEPSGAVGIGRDTRSYQKNRAAAFERMARSPKFRVWAKMEVSRLMTGKSVEEIVDEMLVSKNLKVEVKDEENRWVMRSGETADAPGR